MNQELKLKIRNGLKNNLKSFSSLTALCALSLMAQQANASFLLGYVLGASSSDTKVVVKRVNVEPNTQTACFATIKTPKATALVNLSSISSVDWSSGFIYFKSGKIFSARYGHTNTAAEIKQKGFDPDDRASLPMPDELKLQGGCENSPAASLITTQLNGKSVSFNPNVTDIIYATSSEIFQWKRIERNDASQSSYNVIESNGDAVIYAGIAPPEAIKDEGKRQSNSFAIAMGTFERVKSQLALEGFIWKAKTAAPIAAPVANPLPTPVAAPVAKPVPAVKNPNAPINARVIPRF